MRKSETKMETRGRERRKYEIEREKRINLIFNKSPLNANLDRLIRLLTPLWCHYRLANNISFLSLSRPLNVINRNRFIYTPRPRVVNGFVFKRKSLYFSFDFLSHSLARLTDDFLQHFLFHQKKLKFIL
jgi:hypothetical protein